MPYLKASEVPAELVGQIPVLDYGFTEYVEHWGSDERIVEGARMSTGKGFLGWDPGPCENCDGRGRVGGEITVWDAVPEVRVMGGRKSLYSGHRHKERREIACFVCNGSGKLAGDARLLKFLYTNKHATPFEMAGMTITSQAPIMVYREWHRHRTQCAHPSTMVHFDAPKSRENRRFVYKLSIAELARKWQPTARKSRQKSSCWPRERVHNMQLRMLDESTHEVEHTRIMDVIAGEQKEMFEVIVESGKRITTSIEHRFFTDQGWLTLGQAIDCKARLAVETTASGKRKSWEVKYDWSAEVWKPIQGIEVSSEGRARFGFSSLGTEADCGYTVVRTQAGVRYLHCLVLEAFVGPAAAKQEVRHLNNNRADCRLKNLAYGTSKENAQDRIESDRQQRLRSAFERITSVRSVGLQYCFDLEVEGPYHNFVANGFVIHNSYCEMSARYTPMPDLNYLPTAERCMVVISANKQAGKVAGADDLTHEKALEWLELIEQGYYMCETIYQRGLAIGIPKELARLIVPVGRYSRMMASTDLRNWLAFLTLRMDKNAQWEIRQFANQVGRYIKALYPKTWALFVEGKDYTV